MKLSHQVIQLLALCQLASASPCKPSSLSSDSVIPTSTDIELSATLSTETATSTTIDDSVTVSETESASGSTESSDLVSTSIAEPTTTDGATADSSASEDATATTTAAPSDDIETTTAGETTTSVEVTTTEGATTTDITIATTTADTTPDSPTTTSDVPKPTNCVGLNNPYTDTTGLSYSISCNVDVLTYAISRLISDVPNFVACIEACSPDANCVAANYDKSGRFCYLLSVAEGPYDTPFYDTAYKQVQ